MFEGIAESYRALAEMKVLQKQRDDAEMDRLIETGMTPYEVEMLILRRKEVAALERVSLFRRGQW